METNQTLGPPLSPEFQDPDDAFWARLQEAATVMPDFDAPTSEDSTPEATPQPEKPRNLANWELGNPELPVAGQREQIVEAVDNNQAVVISAETGAGKSTQVPQYLAEQGYKVIVTQPRRLAARTLSERVRDEVVGAKGEDYENFVGFRTAHERDDSPDNRILFCTDGLQLVREMSDKDDQLQEKTVLVLDEVHEWNTNMELSVAWAKKRMKEDPNFKVVLMSATVEGGELAKFFNDDAPLLEVPGRTFPVNKEEGGTVFDSSVNFARQGKNTLVFLPGEREIKEMTAKLQAQNLNVPILPLHGQLDKAEQDKAFQHYESGKIVLATNAAQTSVTIEDIDAVVDSGLERRKEVRHGVEGLYLGAISQADCLQRAGRAGRTKPGEYVLAGLDEESFVPFAERDKHATPEIRRTLLDTTVLRLARTGIDISDLEFFHQPDQAEIASAKRSLWMLGAMTEQGEITKLGKQMESLQMEPHYARMLVEAKKYSPGIIKNIIDIIAIQQAGGIVKNGKQNQGWRELTDEKDSDLLAELDVMVGAQNIDKQNRKDYGIMNRAMREAGDGRKSMARNLQIKKLGDVEAVKPENREAVMKSIIAGLVDQVWQRNPDDGRYKTAGNTTRRQLSTGTVLENTNVIVGSPFDLQTKNPRTGEEKTYQLLQGATKVTNTAWLPQLAPHVYPTARVFAPGNHENAAPSSRDANSKVIGNLVFNADLLRDRVRESVSARISPQPEEKPAAESEPQPQPENSKVIGNLVFNPDLLRNLDRRPVYRPRKHS
jgi:HrpA-like RNA helicase